MPPKKGGKAAGKGKGKGGGKKGGGGKGPTIIDGVPVSEMSKDMIPKRKNSSKQIRPVTFFHQRMLRNKKSKN